MEVVTDPEGPVPAARPAPSEPAAGLGRVVAVPGLGLSVDVPRRTLGRLGPGRAPVAIALPGYGEPAGPQVALQPQALAVRLLDGLGALGIDESVLVGHSASCQIVAEAAALAPARVTALVLLGPTTDQRATTWPALAARWLRTAAWERPSQAPMLVRDYHRTGIRAMARAMDAARRHPVDRAVAACAAPVLVLRGRHDRIVPADWAAALAAVAPDGRAQTLPAGAHMVPLTHPGLVAASIEQFLT